MGVVDRRRVRSVLFRVHKWMGLHLCLLFAIIFATGTLLMFSPEISYYNRSDLWVAPAAAGTEPATVGEIYDAILADQDGAYVDIIAEAPRPWFGRAVLGRGPNGAFVAHVESHSALVLGYGDVSFFHKIIRTLHDSLLIPFSLGHIGVTFLSFFVLAMAVTGLITYRRFWKGFFRMPVKGADPRTRRAAWHRLTGVWIAPFLIASALGSAVFFANAVGWKVWMPEPDAVAQRADPVPASFDGAVLDRIVVGCRERLPAFRDIVVLMPGSPADPVRVEGVDSTVWAPLGGIVCIGDPATGQVTQMMPHSSGNAMQVIKTVATAIHYGTWSGWLSLILWLVFGLGSVFLALTGAQVYASRIARPDGSGAVAEPQGTWALVIRGLGIFKWAYVLLALGICAMIAYRAFA
ncbi:MAG: PepSY domain-containing protein [Silicimonas sp.]|nr:PepSY domain-containing protein [Silicimonas sp.]